MRFALLTLFVLSLFTNAFAGDDKSFDGYYKFGAGTTWTYKKTTTHGDNDNGAIVFNTFDTTVDKVADGKTFMGGMALYVEGDYLVAGAVEKDSVVSNLRVMKFGMKAGESWDGSCVETSEEMKATFVGMEDVETPAGKFKAAHISYVTQGVTLDFYHVAKVGMVKVSIKQDKFHSEQVLQKYTIK